MPTKGFTHERSYEGATNTWLTPKAIIDAVGPFDLDPCAAPEPRPWPTASRHVTLPEDGLAAEWSGLVWMNPPYGPHAKFWLAKMASYDNGIAFVYARTETRMFFEHVWGRASAVVFLRGRVRFHRPDGTASGNDAGTPSVLVGYGGTAYERLGRAVAEGRLDGHFISLLSSVATKVNGR